MDLWRTWLGVFSVVGANSYNSPEKSQEKTGVPSLVPYNYAFKNVIIVTSTARKAVHLGFKLKGQR